MEKIIIVISILLVSVILLFPKEKILDFDGVTLRVLPFNAIIVEKDLSVAKRIKQLYEKEKLFVFEGSVVSFQKKENEAFSQATNKARQELSAFLGAKVSSDVNLREKVSGIRGTFGYYQDASVVVDNFVSSSKVIARWKIPQGKGMFEYHVLVFYDPEAFDTFIKQREHEINLYYVKLNIEKRKVTKFLKIENFEKFRQEFEKIKKIGSAIVIEILNGKIISREKDPILFLIKDIGLEDGKYRIIYLKKERELTLFIFKEAKM
ncbi:hypothetical protein BG95_04980 [Thermosipho sp. 1063]|uniref:hypothetical protein n=1 Tax=Thermosipho sp. 1063 TaxID=1462747 RepID=UPI0009505B67|nr:hypothetical protein [Thermosipho sp. 1063]APT72233.1 hypothetical protein BG95_04980 [Thermosipho sp. 1063]